MVNIRLPVLDLKRSKVAFINPNLTLTFDPATLTLVRTKALTNTNLMCKNYQDYCPLLTISDLPKSPIVAYTGRN